MVVWLKVPGFQAVVLWQVSQRTGIPAAEWLGVVADANFEAWQELQSEGIGVNPFLWQVAQTTEVCAPVSGNPVLAWLKDAFSQLSELWHIAQSVGYDWFLWSFALSYCTWWQLRHSGRAVRSVPWWQSEHWATRW